MCAAAFTSVCLISRCTVCFLLSTKKVLRRTCDQSSDGRRCLHPLLSSALHVSVSSCYHFDQYISALRCFLTAGLFLCITHSIMTCGNLRCLSTPETFCSINKSVLIISSSTHLVSTVHFRQHKNGEAHNSLRKNSKLQSPERFLQHKLG